MLNGDWRDTTLKQIEECFQDNPDVVSLSLFGSTSKLDIQPDKWSDHDVLLVVKDGTLDKFYPSREWLKSFGAIFAIQQNKDEIHCNVKVLFFDFKKIDFVIVTESQTQQELQYLTKQKIIFSKNEEITNALNNAPLKAAFHTLFPFERMVEEFWYIAFVAVIKLARNDLLISLHLALELYRKCLELGMWFRDRETGTNVHRIGGIRNDLIEKMHITLQGTSKKDILGLIQQSCKGFDILAHEWSEAYKDHFSVFEKILNMVKGEIES